MLVRIFCQSFLKYLMCLRPGTSKTRLYIEPGSPWENGYIESFNDKFRDELLNCEIFETLFEAKVLIEKGVRSVICFDRIARLGTCHLPRRQSNRYSQLERSGNWLY